MAGGRESRPMEARERMTAASFIAEAFRLTSERVLLARLPGHKEITTRKAGEVTQFLKEHDQPGHGVYFCVGTIRAGATVPKGGQSLRYKDNCAELGFLFADTDAKDIDDSIDEARERIRTALPLPPSRINNSGRGIHAYWFLKEPLDLEAERNRAEALLRQLADLVGGDLSAAEVARLMRLPGSHNTKDGGWLEVTSDGDDRRYDISDIEDMLSICSPVVRRREPAALRPGASGRCPWEAAARLVGYKPPVDIEARLKAMRWRGAGDSAIHATQLSVSAAMMLAGRPEDEIVAAILGATRAAAGEYGSRWNWAREERAVRRMCADWARKHPNVHEMPRRERATGTDERRGPAEVHSMRERRQRQTQEDNGTPAHIALGAGVLKALLQRGEALLFTPKGAWRYADGLWSLMVSGAPEFLNVCIEEGCRALALKSTNRLASEARGWIMRQPHLWRADVPWDQHGKVPTRSGLIDPLTLEVEPAKPEHYCTWRVEAEFDPGADCPLWRQMVSDTFGDRPAPVRGEIVGVIQEVLGAGFTDAKPRALSKGLILQGPSNAGKTGLIDVMSGMFSGDPITAALDSLDNSHGLMPFVRRAPWTLHEAFEQAKWHFSASVKAIITGEPINVNIKNGPILSTRVKGPAFWGTNYPPQFKEATHAIVNRFVVLKCRRVFDEDAPAFGVAAEAERRGFDRPAQLILATERAGILNWGLMGLKRARERGRLMKTEEITQTRTELHQAGNIVAGFVEECIDFDKDTMVSVPDFCAAFSVWWTENKGETRNTISNESIGRAVTALADERIGTHPKELRDNRRRYYAGISLNGLGIEYHTRALKADQFEGKTTLATESGGVVNRDIPTAWLDRPSVVSMQKAARDRTACQREGTVFRETVTKGTVTDSSPGDGTDTGSVTTDPTPPQVAEESGEILF
jgi:hypothetical protein